MWSGTRASYVALSAISILALSLLTSIWLSDTSGSVALLGLLSVYLTSQELLMLVSSDLGLLRCMCCCMGRLRAYELTTSMAAAMAGIVQQSVS